ncbi:hypothetical protein OG792_25120 [Micromonospora sp. NBC_01699]|uniref:hypothetical protein n=1 Tax=Micromonospora sp. NBC_01699 TaxID=2975984 RepID=UPI002E2D4A4F|nr:hypothetical protein [Micromonospora sp. NBC_01699]
MTSPDRAADPVPPDDATPQAYAAPQAHTAPQAHAAPQAHVAPQAHAGLERVGGITERVVLVANFVAPVTVLTSLLLYFGYAGTRARMQYFGVYLDLANLSNLDLALYGLEVLFFPAAMIFMALFLGAAAHGVITWLLSAPERDTLSLSIAALMATVGVLGVGRALVGLLSANVSRAEFPGTTPLTMAFGPALVAYGAWIGWRVSRRQPAGRPSRILRLLDWFGGVPARQIRRVALTGVGGLLVAGLFWAANNFAWAYGAGRAYDDALNLPDRPQVWVDTRERLIDPPPGVTETLLPGAPASPAAVDIPDRPAFQYRYGGLRLLLEADGRLYLVPGEWTEQGRTIVLPHDTDVRLQLVP